MKRNVFLIFKGEKMFAKNIFFIQRISSSSFTKNGSVVNYLACIYNDFIIVVTTYFYILF